MVEKVAKMGTVTRWQFKSSRIERKVCVNTNRTSKQQRQDMRRKELEAYSHRMPGELIQDNGIFGLIKRSRNILHKQA